MVPPNASRMAGGADMHRANAIAKMSKGARKIAISKWFRVFFSPNTETIQSLMEVRPQMKKIDVAVHVEIFATIAIIFLTTMARTAIAETLDIYYIDVEGGQSTLIVVPNGETLLIDAGYPGEGKSDSQPGDASNARDAMRIAAAARDAGVSHIDYLLITHFHADHFGGAAELSQLISIGTFIDHDAAAPEALSNPATLTLVDAYKKARAEGNHIVPAVGDRLPLQGVEATVVSSAGSTLASPLAGAGAINASCGRTLLAASEPYENPRSTGVLIRYGEFRFLDLGDLTGQPLYDLVCPTNRIGPVDVYLVPHHGGEDSADPATFAAFRPRVAILNNGPVKGGAAPIFEALRDVDGLLDVWQIHRSETEGARNFSEDRIANLDEQSAHWIKLSANRDGSFRIQNGRTGAWIDYNTE